MLEFGDRVTYTHIIERPPFNTIKKNGVFIKYEKDKKKREWSEKQREVYVVFEGNKSVSKVPIFSIEKVTGGEE